MIDQARLQEKWRVLRGSLHERWEQLSRNDLKSFDGDIDRLVGLIQRKTGEARDNIEGVLDELSNSAVSTVDQVATRAKDTAAQTSESIRDGSNYVRNAVEEGYDVASEFTRNRPGQSAMFFLGLGVVIGFSIGISMQER